MGAAACWVLEEGARQCTRNLKAFDSELAWVRSEIILEGTRVISSTHELSNRGRFEVAADERNYNRYAYDEPVNYEYSGRVCSQKTEQEPDGRVADQA